MFQHEADLTFPSFVDALEDGQPWNTPGIVYRLDGQVRSNPPMPFVAQIDSLPFPRFDLLPDRERYLPTVVSSRGCSFNCIYCSTKCMWCHWRPRSPDNVIAEIDWLYSLGYRTCLAFSDDEFVASRSRAMRIAALMLERGYQYEWGIAGRIELIDEEMLDLFSRAGCRQIFFGIESGSDRVRRFLKRRFTAAEVEQMVDRCFQFGIVPIVSFMVGIPHETREDALQTLELMRRINTYRIQLSVFTPLVGTPVFVDPEAYGIRLDPAARDPRRMNIDVGTVVHTTEHLDRDEIRELWLEGQGIIMNRYREGGRYESMKREVKARQSIEAGSQLQVAHA